MFTYTLRRLLYSIPVLLAATFIIFAFVRSTVDPAAAFRQNPYFSQRALNAFIERKHLDKPIPVQYGYWLKGALTGDLGTTIRGDRPIWPQLRRVFGNTMQLIIAAELLAVLLAIAIGVISAVRQYSLFDYASTTFSFLGFATPIFWLALILQIIFTNIFLDTGKRIFYTAGLSSPDPGSGLHFLMDRVQHLALPVFVLAVVGIAQFSRYMRASMLEVINSDYVRTARAKGLIERRVIMKHGFRNALIPLVTVVALDFGALFGGAIVTETVFSLDGMGLFFIHALEAGDAYQIMAWLAVTATIIILFNLIADLLYGVLDPRIRYE
jgi:peptide/nickel transport system permease protein